MKIYKKVLYESFFGFFRVLYIIFIFILAALPSYAEKIPVKIAPIQMISTHSDEIEIGDWIKFETVNDVQVNNDLYIKKNTEVIGIVDFVHQNGWGGDSAEICFKNFYTKDINNKKVVISSPLTINGNAEMANSARDLVTHGSRIALFYYPYAALMGHNYGGFIFRGAEIFIEPDQRIFNLFIER